MYKEQNKENRIKTSTYSMFRRTHRRTNKSI
nr:MAG TPA: hypothetical protein [Caudoviricetes sp.]